MPAELDDELKGEIVKRRALDYDKQQIAEDLGISRKTVSRHLTDIREEAEQSDNPDAVVVEKVLAATVGAGIGVGLGFAIKAFFEALQEGQSEELEGVQVAQQSEDTLSE